MISTLAELIQHPLVNALCRISARLDDKHTITPTDKPGDLTFLSMTRSHAHIVAWFILYSATESNDQQKVLGQLNSIFPEDQSLYIDQKELVKLIKEEVSWGELFKQANIELKIKSAAPNSLFKDRLNANGNNKLAEAIDPIVEQDLTAQGVVIESTFQLQASWSRPLKRDGDYYLLSAKKTQFYYYNGKEQALTCISAARAVELAKRDKQKFRVIENQGPIEIEIPKNPPLEIKVTPTEISSGIYEVFKDTHLAGIIAAIIRVFISGAAKVDEYGTYVEQTQFVSSNIGDTPLETRIRFNHRPSVNYAGAFIHVNFDNNTKTAPKIDEKPQNGLVLAILTKNSSQLPPMFMAARQSSEQALDFLLVQWRLEQRILKNQAILETLLADLYKNDIGDEEEEEDEKNLDAPLRRLFSEAILNIHISQKGDYFIDSNDFNSIMAKPEEGGWKRMLSFLFEGIVIEPLDGETYTSGLRIKNPVVFIEKLNSLGLESGTQKNIDLPALPAPMSAKKTPSPLAATSSNHSFFPPKVPANIRVSITEEQIATTFDLADISITELKWDHEDLKIIVQDFNQAKMLAKRIRGVLEHPNKLPYDRLDILPGGITEMDPLVLIGREALEHFKKAISQQGPQPK